MPPPNNDETIANLPKAVAANLDNDGPNKRLKSNEQDGVGGVSTPRVVSSADTSRINSPIEVESPDATTSSTSSSNDGDNDTPLQQCLHRLFTSLPATLASSPPKNRSEQDAVSSFRELWTMHGFRTTMVSSPRPAVSVYLGSCHNPTAAFLQTNNNNDNEAGRAFLLCCIGMNPTQLPLESHYDATVKNVYCLMLFLKRMKNVRKEDMENDGVVDIVGPWEKKIKELLTGLKLQSTTATTVSKSNDEDSESRIEIEKNIDDATTTTTTTRQNPTKLQLQELSESSPRILSHLLAELVRIDHSLRTDQLLHEYNRIAYENCTFANACLQRWLSSEEEETTDTDDSNGNSNNKSNGNHGKKKQQTYDLDQVYYKPSPPGRYLPKYERITIHFKDPNAVEPNMAKLIFLPSLTRILTSNSTAANNVNAATNATNDNVAGKKTKPNHPLDAVADDMITSTWEELLRNGYYVDQKRKEYLGPELKKFYTSGLLGGKAGGNMPILLNAHFNPTYPLSLYLHGTAGSGKSSLVRNLLPALNASISKNCDPELLVRFVKQNLNKPFVTLQLELDLRPNNNDYSVMSIIQGRRMTLAQSKPGLVLVALEEMPSDVEGADPKQGDVGRLVSMRFSGRKGDLNECQTKKNAPRNSTKRGISGDATIISIFTSNYNLEQSTLEALQRLEMFENLTVVEVAPVAGEDRMAFSLSYLMQRVDESLGSSWTRKVQVAKLDIPVGEGDTRPLVRYLRMLAFYIHALVLSSKQPDNTDSIDVSISFDAMTSITTITTTLNEEKMQLKPGSFNNLYAVKPPSLDQRASDTVAELQKLHPNLQNPTELSQILDFYFAKTLAPAVIISQDKALIGDLIKLLSQAEGVHGISDIDPTSYKMMKSLYDAHDTPNLRDDILQILHSNNKGTSVAVELVCQSTDAQLQIREIIEDTPSMTAFSTERSALHKDGLLFGVFVKEGVEITPEIKSRASLVI